VVVLNILKEESYSIVKEFWKTSAQFKLKKEKVCLRRETVNLSFHTYSIPIRGSTETVPKPKLVII